MKTFIHLFGFSSYFRELVFLTAFHSMLHSCVGTDLKWAVLVAGMMVKTTTHLKIPKVWRPGECQKSGPASTAGPNHILHTHACESSRSAHWGCERHKIDQGWEDLMHTHMHTQRHEDNVKPECEQMICLAVRANRLSSELCHSTLCHSSTLHSTHKRQSKQAEPIPVANRF